MVNLREARQAAARVGIGLQYVIKEARVFDIWSKICPALLSDEMKKQARARGTIYSSSSTLARQGLG